MAALNACHSRHREPQAVATVRGRAAAERGSSGAGGEWLLARARRQTRAQ
jgi:hypothetical protein